MMQTWCDSIDIWALSNFPSHWIQSEPPSKQALAQYITFSQSIALQSLWYNLKEALLT